MDAKTPITDTATQAGWILMADMIYRQYDSSNRLLNEFSAISPSRRKLLYPRPAQILRRHRDPKTTLRIEAEKKALRDARSVR